MMPDDDFAYTPSPTIRAVDALAETLRNRVGSLQDYFAAVRQTEGDPLRQQPEKLSAQGSVTVRQYAEQLAERPMNVSQTDAEKAAAYWRGLAAAEDRRQASATLEQKQDLIRKPTLGL